MASLPMSDCCVKGAFDQGTPQRGSFEIVGDTECYVSPATPQSSTAKTLVMLTDGGGYRAPSNTTLADIFAAAGYRVVVPDLFRRNPFPFPPPEDFDVADWAAQHTPPVVQPIVDRVLAALKSDTPLGVAGYCFGGGYAFRALHGPAPLARCAFVAHPAAMPASDVVAVTRPVSIAAAQNDYIFPKALQHETEEILAAKDLPWELTVYGGTEHGFAARADLTDGRQRIARDAALRQALGFFAEHL